jgi:hypothetical protein
MPANTTFTAGAVLTAQQMNNLPWGVVDATAGGTGGRGYAVGASNFSLTTSEADVTGMTVTFTPVTGRIYRATFTAMPNNVASNQDFVAIIADGSNVTLAERNEYVLAAQRGSIDVSKIFTGLSGSTTLKVRARTTVASGANFLASNFGFYFVVEDIGPAS